jgi:hypothetical protein
VAGLPAYFRGTGLFTQSNRDAVIGLKAEVVNLANPRLNADNPSIRGIWNGRNRLNPCSIAKRQETRSACSLSARTKTTLTTTTTVAPPSPTIANPVGFHVISLFTTNPDGSTNSSIEVVGSANDMCSTVVVNRDKYRAFGLFINGTNGIATGFMRNPYNINSTTIEFGLLQGTTAPLCGMTDSSFFGYFMLFTNPGSGTGNFGKLKASA